MARIAVTIMKAAVSCLLNQAVSKKTSTIHELCQLIKLWIEEIKGYVARYLPLLTDWLGRGATTHVCIVGAKGWTTTPVQPHVLSAAEQKKEGRKKNPNCACFLLTSRTEALRTHFDSTTWPRCDIFYKLLKIEILPVLLLDHGKFIWPNNLQVPQKSWFLFAQLVRVLLRQNLIVAFAPFTYSAFINSYTPPAHPHIFNNNSKSLSTETEEEGK